MRKIVVQNYKSGSINIPQELLNIQLGEDYETGPYTIADGLKEIKGEVITWIKYITNDDSGELKVEEFSCYTNTYFTIMLNLPWGDSDLYTFERNPPEHG